MRQYSFGKKLPEKSLAKNFFNKTARNKLVKLTPRANFIIVLGTNFTLIVPKCVKDTDDLTVIFTLLGSMSAKAVRRTLMKLTPDEHRLSKEPEEN